MTASCGMAQREGLRLAVPMYSPARQHKCQRLALRRQRQQGAEQGAATDDLRERGGMGKDEGGVLEGVERTEVKLGIEPGAHDDPIRGGWCNTVKRPCGEPRVAAKAFSYRICRTPAHAPCGSPAALPATGRTP